MRKIVLLASLSLMGCPLLLDSPDGGSKAGKVAGKLNVFQGAKSAPQGPTLAGILADRQPKLRPPVPTRQLLESRIPVAPPLPQPSHLTEWIPGEVIVRMIEKIPVAQALAVLRVPGLVVTHGGFSSEYLHLVKVTHLDLTPLTIGETLELAQTFGKYPGVRFTEVNRWQHMFAVPNDKLYSAQWHYQALNMPAAWDVTQGNASVVVADIDTGIVPHPDLDPRVISGIDMISDSEAAGDGDGRDNDPLDMGGDQPQGASSWHGTHTAGTIGAASNNTTGIAGVDWNARLLPVRVLGKQGGTLADIAAGMTWATGGTVPGSRANTTPAKVVNMSLGGVSDGPSATYQDVINTANAGGAIFVIAAGNANEDAQKTIPCIQTDVICVGATRFSGKRASYSNYGSVVTVMAPGGETAEDANGDGEPDGVLSTFRDKMNQPSLQWNQGTSMATPHVAGIVALMKAINPAITVATARTHLTSTANAAYKCTEGCGAGMVNAQAALLAAKGTPPTGPAKLSVSATELFLATAAPTVSIGISNVGSMPLMVNAAKSGTAANNLTFPKGTSVTVAGGQTGNLEVTGTFSGLADGVHTASIALTSNGGDATVNVKLRIGGGSGRPATVGLIFQSADGGWNVAATTSATVASGYAYSIEAPAGKFYVLGLVDENGNDMFEDTEPLGLYPTLDSPKQITVEVGTNLTNIDFPLVPFKPVKDDSASSIGGACTSACPNGGMCETAWPGGYCTKDCTMATCPLGSTCIGSGPLYCLASCTGPQTGQSNCRTGYVCYDDDTGKGVCLPRCATNTDCGASGVCNTGTGYCQ